MIMKISNKKPAILYHYTTMSALYSIINGIDNSDNSMVDSERNFILYASNYLYANDPSECDFSSQCILKALQQYEQNMGLEPKASVMFEKLYLENKDLLGEPCILSFSEEKDDLSMWRMYGANGQGVAIGIEVAALNEYGRDSKFVKCEYYEENAVIENYLRDKGMSGMHDVLVTLKDKINCIDNFDIKLVPLELLSELYNIIYNARIRAKQMHYYVENEWRLTFNTKSNEYKFREKDGLIIPYIPIDFKVKHLKEIIIGPCANKELALISCRKFLESKIGIFSETISVLPSCVPYVIR